LLEIIFKFFRKPAVSPRASLVSPNVVTKLQFIRIETELVYIGRRRTTSFNENDTHVNTNCKLVHLTRKHKYQNDVSVFGPPCVMCVCYNDSKVDTNISDRAWIRWYCHPGLRMSECAVATDVFDHFAFCTVQYVTFTQTSVFSIAECYS